MTRRKIKRKQDIINWLKFNCSNFTNYQIEQAIEVFFKNISNALTAGHKVELRGLGTILVKTRKKMMARNPRTNQWAEVKCPKRLHFRASRTLLKKLNAKLSPE